MRMNCRTCQHELSQCLDGRLPSGRRAAVMQHADGCADCAAFWSELQQAQELILRLPRQRTGGGFREALWERIQSGEGTPPAVFHEPVPVATKVRYVATGAAAAALLLIAFHFGTNRSSATPEQLGSAKPRAESVTASPPVASVTPPAITQPLTARLAGFEPFTPTLMGHEAAVQFDANLALAKDYAERLPRAADDGIASRLCDRAGEMTRLGRVLLDLQAHQHVWFPDAVGSELKLVVDQFDKLYHRGDPAMAAGPIATVLHGVTPLNLQRQLLSKVSYSCSELEGFQRRWAEHPDVFRLLFVAGPEAGGACPDQLHLSLSLVPQGDCETRVLVVPRSRMQGEGYSLVLRTIGTGR